MNNDYMLGRFNAWYKDIKFYRVKYLGITYIIIYNL